MCYTRFALAIEEFTTTERKAHLGPYVLLTTGKARSLSHLCAQRWKSLMAK